jgi:hypothetical protein
MNSQIKLTIFSQSEQPNKFDRAGEQMIYLMGRPDSFYEKYMKHIVPGNCTITGIQSVSRNVVIFNKKENQPVSRFEVEQDAHHTWVNVYGPMNNRLNEKILDLAPTSIMVKVYGIGALQPVGEQQWKLFAGNLCLVLRVKLEKDLSEYERKAIEQFRSHFSGIINKQS